MSRPPVKNEQVLEDTDKLGALLIERSAPDPTRPLLSAEREKRLAAVEQKSAACYAQTELLTIKMQRLATDIEAFDKNIDRANIPKLIEQSNDSVALHLNNLREQIKNE
jgi:hypothetical protein